MMTGFIVIQVYIGYVKGIKRLQCKRKRDKINNEIDVPIKNIKKVC